MNIEIINEIITLLAERYPFSAKELKIYLLRNEYSIDKLLIELNRGGTDVLIK